MKYLTLKQDNGQPFLIFINETPKTIRFLYRQPKRV